MYRFPTGTHVYVKEFDTLGTVNHSIIHDDGIEECVVTLSKPAYPEERLKMWTLRFFASELERIDDEPVYC